MGYEAATPIQSRAIPEAVQGRDLIATAQTGTGKTAAFLLPILERTLELPPGRIYALILTPTRELAVQAEMFLRKLGRYTRRRGAAVYGGVGMGDQVRALQGGAEVIVATPGRLLDHMERGYVRFDALKILVLDEADRMLDMGFLPDVRRILARLPRQRQTMLFSATMPAEVVQLSRDFMVDPRMVHVGPQTVAAVGVSHLVLPVPSHLKAPLLREVLRDETMSSVLVFTRTKHRADRLARQLSQWGISAGVIHGNRSQSQRQRALEGFRGGLHRVLVATDIAARGIDVEGVSHVVNFDVPHEPEVYIHRVGRTARAQRRGDAFTLLSPEEEDDFARIEQLLGYSIHRARLPEFAYDAPTPSRAELPPRGRSHFRQERRPSGRSGTRGHAGHGGGRPTAESPSGTRRRVYRRW
ncbi:MAG TPA: DEAD/DEAH box helicase [Thermoplasmata archaeon]|nr:DEAD/DEAH box helicase [Thermoplasmata archaeon]